MLRPLQWLENEFEMENSQPIQLSSPKPDFVYQQWKDSLSKDIDTKEDKEEFLLIGEQLSSVFPGEGSGCDNSTAENLSVKNVSAFNDTVTHNHHKKSKQKSEEAPVTEKRQKAIRLMLDLRTLPYCFRRNPVILLTPLSLLHQ